METRKKTLSTLKVCRFCLTTDETLISLYDNKVRAPKNSVPFALKILACIAIEIFPSDNMPQYICQRCKLFMELSYAFKQLCRQADEAILQYIQMGTPLAPMPWPTQLTKTYRAYNKSAEGNIVKTVVQGGATVKVMTEEISDSEEGDDDNVYNVKIRDGSDQAKSIKIITSVQDKPEQSSSKRSRQDSEDADNSEVGLMESGCYACDECECTYPLEQLLALHKAQKHRVRNISCEECDGKFFSKYDLMTHQLTHSNEMPFQCVACDKKFKRLILLKRHEKMMHSELPQQSCLHCPATFLSVEELEVHQQRHERHTVRPFICYICDKKFHDKTILQKHTALVHNKKPAFSCQYCPEQFPSVSKLKRHVREHAGVRPYPCKHCDKSFMKSHHYTRHLRVKHSETIRSAGPYEADAYRCDECDDTFTTQDDLMYHSALHATTNLTCPLCQEKFEDVDTVTAHIKSHVNGAEYMCDFCELIFTSKEKLDNHIASSHDDELLANDQDTEHDESSMDMDAEDEDDDNSINVKEEDYHMVVEIKKAGDYMLPAAVQRDEEYKTDNTQSEDSDVTNNDSPVTEMETMPTPKKQRVVISKDTTITKIQDLAAKEALIKTEPTENHGRMNPTNILRKAEEIKRKAIAVQQQMQLTPATDKKEKVNKVESTTPSGASDKSLRLLEKELQDLKRTNTRVEVPKTPSRSLESQRNRRLQLHTSTPKIRPMERKEAIAAKLYPEKVIMPEKRQPERKVPKEPKEIKSNNNSIKDDRELKSIVKEDKEDRKEKETAKEDKKEKDKENPKVIKNGASETPAAVVEDTLRRSTRPSKFKDYAKMIRDSSMNSDENDSEDDELAEYKEQDKTPEATRARGQRGSNKQPPVATPVKPPTPATAAKTATLVTAAKAATPVTTAKAATPVTAGKAATPVTAAKIATPAPVTPATAPRKRGRPRKEKMPAVVPSKIKKDEPSEEETDVEPPKAEPSKPEAAAPAVAPPTVAPPKEDAPKENEPDNFTERMKTPEASKLPSEQKPGVIISPSGQTLKQVPIRALPPGVKPLPLPVNSRLGGGEVCEMQIGKKMVKVQKIVMTKAEVEAMAKKGLVEMKDGTMVLKQGIKLPSADPAALKSSLVGDGENKKESPTKVDKPAPTRCDMDA